MSEPEFSGNPYAASQHTADAQVVVTREGMSLLRGFGIVCLSGVAGLALGALFGFIIGTFFPDYYHAVFRSTRVDPVQVGIALGLTQGVGVGLAVGCAVVIGVAISSRRNRPSQPEASRRRAVVRLPESAGM
jgi:hypothetical protein